MTIKEMTIKFAIKTHLLHVVRRFIQNIQYLAVLLYSIIAVWVHEFYSRYWTRGRKFKYKSLNEYHKVKMGRPTRPLVDVYLKVQRVIFWPNSLKWAEPEFIIFSRDRQPLMFILKFDIQSEQCFHVQKRNLRNNWV